MEMPENTANPQTIAQCERIIRPHIRRTPVIEVNGEDFGLPAATLTLKLELLQHSGSFKARGAFANVLTREVPKAGVVAASGGNHGAATAYAAMELGKRAKIFVPSVSSPAKIQRIREYGADLAIEGDSYADALAASEAWAQQTGAMPIPAFDQNETILGQGTLGLELEQQAADIDTVLVSVGGGGLIAGIAAWYAGRVKVVGVEPFASPTLTKRSRPDIPSMQRLAAWQRIRWRRGASARKCFRSSRNMRGRPCWFRTTRSRMRRQSCGVACASWPSPEGPRHSPPYCPAPINLLPGSGSLLSLAAAIPLR